MLTIHGRKITDEDMAIIATYMNDEIREHLHSMLAPCTHDEFIMEYLETSDGPELQEILEREFDLEIIPKYEVVKTIQGDEFTDLETDDRMEAINHARYIYYKMDRSERKRADVEVRERIRKIADPTCDGWECNAIPFRVFVQEREAGNQIEELEIGSLEMAVERAKEMIEDFEADDREDGTFMEGFYEIADEDHCRIEEA